MKILVRNAEITQELTLELTLELTPEPTREHITQVSTPIKFEWLWVMPFVRQNECAIGTTIGTTIDTIASVATTPSPTADTRPPV